MLSDPALRAYGVRSTPLGDLQRHENRQRLLLVVRPFLKCAVQQSPSPCLFPFFRVSAIARTLNSRFLLSQAVSCGLYDLLSKEMKRLYAHGREVLNARFEALPC